MHWRTVRRLLGIKSPSGTYARAGNMPSLDSINNLIDSPALKNGFFMSPEHKLPTPDEDIAEAQRSQLAEAQGMTIDTSLIRSAGAQGPFRGIPKAGHFLTKARETIEGPREQEYGDKTENFQRIADLWSPIFGIKITREQVAMAMNQVKISRLVNSPNHEDSWIDAIGYMAIGAEVREARDGK